MEKSAVKNRWVLKKIREIGQVVTGKTPPTAIKEYFGDKFPFITPTDITGENRFINEPARYLSDKGHDFQKKLAIPSHAICFTCIGSTVGKMAITNRVSFTNQQINSIIVDSNIADYKYIFYLLKTDVERIKNYAGGAAKPIVSKSIFEEISIPCPSLPIQQKIASILSAYDDLIELNKLRIKILEEIAKLIYKEWFVKFRFPGHEKMKMVKSELGLIPEGWKATNLGTVLDSIESGSRPKGGVEGFSDGVPSIGAESVLGLGKFDFNKTKYISKSFFGNMRSGIIKNGDVLLYKDGACIGRKTYFDEDFPFKTCCINEHVFILRVNKRISQKYLFFWLDQFWVTQEIINLNSNAAQPGINKPSVKTLPILIPKREIITLFDEIVTPIIKMLFTCCKQNIALRQTRDMLLPKLLSGEIDVSALDIDIKQNL